MQAGTDFSLPSRHSTPPDQLAAPPSPLPSARLTGLPPAHPRVPPLCPAGMADMRACSCPLCVGGIPNGFSLASRATWFAYRRLRSGRPRRPPRRAAAAGAAPAAADAAPVAVSAGPAGAARTAAQADLGDSGWGGGRENAAAGSSDEALDTTAAASEPWTQRPIGECIPADVFQDSIDDFVAYNFLMQHCLSREAMDDYLRQRRSSGSCRTPHTLNSMVKSSVDIFTKKVDCCRASCVAFSAHRKDLDACDVCHAPRYRIDGKPRMQATYWPLLPWIRILGPAWSRLWKKHERPLQLAHPKISAIGSTAKSFASSSHRATADPPILSSSTRNGSWRYGSCGTGHLLVKRSGKQLLSTNLRRPIGSPTATSVQNRDPSFS